MVAVGAGGGAGVAVGVGEGSSPQAIVKTAIEAAIRINNNALTRAGTRRYFNPVLFVRVLLSRSVRKISPL